MFEVFALHNTDLDGAYFLDHVPPVQYVAMPYHVGLTTKAQTPAPVVSWGEYAKRCQDFVDVLALHLIEFFGDARTFHPEESSPMRLTRIRFDALGLTIPWYRTPVADERLALRTIVDMMTEDSEFEFLRGVIRYAETIMEVPASFENSSYKCLRFNCLDTQMARRVKLELDQHLGDIMPGNTY
jgi:hypothetical protein